MLAAHLPHDLLIPDITIDEAVAAGIGVLRSRGVPLLGAADVSAELETALREKQATPITMPPRPGSCY